MKHRLSNRGIGGFDNRRGKTLMFGEDYQGGWWAHKDSNLGPAD